MDVLIGSTPFRMRVRRKKSSWDKRRENKTTEWYLDNDRNESHQEKAKRIDEKLKNLEEEVRWMNARKVKNYKFEGDIPAAKDANYYLPSSYV